MGEAEEKHDTGTVVTAIAYGFSKDNWERPKYYFSPKQGSLIEHRSQKTIE